MHFYSLIPRLSPSVLQVTESWVGPGDEPSIFSVEWTLTVVTIVTIQWVTSFLVQWNFSARLVMNLYLVVVFTRCVRMSNRLLLLQIQLQSSIPCYLHALGKCKLPQVPKTARQKWKVIFNWKWSCRSNTKNVGGRGWCMWLVHVVGEIPPMRKATRPTVLGTRPGPTWFWLAHWVENN